MSGYELTEAVLQVTNVPYEKRAPSYAADKGREYRAGWILAYYQWKTAMRFEDMVRDGLTLSTVLSMYILHEADESKFIEAVDAIIAGSRASRKGKLHRISHKHADLPVGAFVTTNRESGDGRYGIQLKPIQRGLPGILTELKAEQDCFYHTFLVL